VSAVRTAAAFALALGLALACGRPTSFVCSESSDCTDGSFNGTCQANGYCSFGDDTCPSGQRYGDLASGKLAGMCVDGEGTSTGVDPTTGAGPETTLGTLDDPTLDGGTLDGTTTGGTTTGGESSSTGKPVDDESTTQPNGMTDTPEDSGDTMVPDNCGGMMPGDECNACAYESCCVELVACSVDKMCLCYYECAARGAPADTCEGACGPSMTFEALNTCLLVHCPIECGAMMP
jgi:hypothetical protein